MTISIEYCGTCNYRPAAARLALAIQQETGVKPELVHSREMGALEVIIDGKLIFSKKALGRFPEPAEIIDIVKRTQGR